MATILTNSYHMSALLALLASLVTIVSPETVMYTGEENQDFDFDGLPGVQHEFKIEVTAGREECFYQSIKQGATFLVTFQVLRGADRNIDVVIRRPDGSILASHLWVHEGNTEEVIDMPGVHSVCIDNSFSRFSSKLVYVYIITYSLREWQQFSEQMESFDGSVGNSTQSLWVVDKNVNSILRSQAMSRQSVVADWYLISGNNSFIQRWSIAMCVVVMISSGVQTYFIRKLFGAHDVKPTATTSKLGI